MSISYRSYYSFTDPDSYYKVFFDKILKHLLPVSYKDQINKQESLFMDQEKDVKFGAYDQILTKIIQKQGDIEKAKAETAKQYTESTLSSMLLDLDTQHQQYSQGNSQNQGNASVKKSS